MGGATMATRYCCYLLDIDRIAAVCIIECDDDAAALQEASHMVDTAPCSAAEVWDRTRKVSIIWKKDVAAPAAMLRGKSSGNRGATLVSKITRRLLSREQAAFYVGLSPNAFEQEVAAGTFPAPAQLGRVRRRLWDLKAIDAVLDKAMGIHPKAGDRERREREWSEEKSKPSANRPWLERERREREERESAAVGTINRTR
jgi:predicted DNA-binding transcriptional regulator AlpA